jgi:SAM-dependent methyltransferase
VLAVDLSRASLAYAKRKAWEAGLDRITFAQADILELGKIDQAFDMIAVCGVLHHMREPFVGWRVLLSKLRAHGVMAVGLYSEVARSHVKAARAIVAERGFGPTPADIRRCRQELLALPDGALARKVTQAEDFFTISECRDLLFHVQESRHTLPEIAAFLASEKLEFLGFELRGAVRARYREQFPDDLAMTNLDHWHRFETDNLDTFTGMYYFWVQKR